MEKVATKDQKGDLLTKAYSKETLARLAPALGLRRIAARTLHMLMAASLVLRSAALETEAERIPPPWGALACAALFFLVVGMSLGFCLGRMGVKKTVIVEERDEDRIVVRRRLPQEVMTTARGECFHVHRCNAIDGKAVKKWRMCTFCEDDSSLRGRR